SRPAVMMVANMVLRISFPWWLSGTAPAHTPHAGYEPGLLAGAMFAAITGRLPGNDATRNLAVQRRNELQGALCFRIACGFPGRIPRRRLIAVLSFDHHVMRLVDRHLHFSSDAPANRGGVVSENTRHASCLR